MKKLFFIFISMLLLASCSMQKRHYMKGYYVSNSKNSESNKVKSVNKYPDNTISASIENTGPISISSSTYSKDTTICDTILLNDGYVIIAKILENATYEMYYRDCDYADGSVKSIRKKDIRFVSFGNGSKEIIKQSGDAVVVKKDSLRQDTIRKPIKPLTKEEWRIQNRKKPINGWALASMILLPFWFLSIPFALIALVQMYRHPDRWRKKVFSTGLLIWLALFLFLFLLVIAWAIIFVLGIII